MVYPLVKEWAPRAYVVTFKLETDQSILISKAQGALKKYGHQLVIANILSTRKREITFVTPKTEEKLVLTAEDETAGKEIEDRMIPKVMHLHSDFLTAS